MKLAEALSQRSELQKLIARAEYQLHSVARVQEGEEMDDSPGELIQEIEKNLMKLEKLSAQINKTNMKIILPNGKTITEMIEKLFYTLQNFPVRRLLTIHAQQEQAST